MDSTASGPGGQQGHHRLADERMEYGLQRADLPRGPGRLLEANAPDDPLVLFDTWLEEAFAVRDVLIAAIPDTVLLEPTAMTVSTIADGRPRSRTVLLKERTSQGLVFYTNLESAKGTELSAQPLVALQFVWPPLQRQVRVEGQAHPLARDAVEAYFAIRPRESQLGAWASPQSRVVADAEELADRYRAVEERFAGGDVPCPPHWGGFVVDPDRMEFWQGGPGRMHDRLRYRRRDVDVWARDRLAP